MGCDIHAYTEYYKDGQWHTGDSIVTEEYYGETKPRIPSRFRIWNGRNYNFFAWIANVRNNTWGEHIPPISEPKGLPEDSCEFIKQESENWNGDGHSHSYLTLEEIKTAWQQAETQMIEFNGAVDIRNPDEKMQKWLNTPEKERNSPPHGYCAAGTHCIPMKWVEPLQELVKFPYNRIQDFLWNIKWDKQVKETEVRMVFWFDN